MADTPIKRSSIVDVDPSLIIDGASDNVRASVLNHIDRIAAYTGTDIFLLNPKVTDPEAAGMSFSGGAETSLDQRYRFNIFGDVESVEHAKTRVLMMIDQIVGSDVAFSNKTDLQTAQAQNRCHQIGIDNAYSCLWADPQEYQAHRISD